MTGALSTTEMLSIAKPKFLPARPLNDSCVVEVMAAGSVTVADFQAFTSPAGRSWRVSAIFDPAQKTLAFASDLTSLLRGPGR